ncbi:hypothetical protein [Rhizobium sp. BK491]|uniref:phosphotransferase family protein n=1 Tax=Rhizobium sp. BK491 TaxID=2587009 RepID=UPI001614909F|nr:hypothetical protein [Rhizobium sp. BK491]MBB3571252.1 hypothetical protein [Rhizobium sp. BK491]
MAIEQGGAEEVALVSDRVLGRLISQTDHAKVELFDADGTAYVRKTALGDVDAFRSEVSSHSRAHIGGQPLAPVTQVGVSGRYPFYQTPFYGGGTLRDRLVGANYNEAIARPLISELLAKLAEGFLSKSATASGVAFADYALVSRPRSRLERFCWQREQTHSGIIPTGVKASEWTAMGIGDAFCQVARSGTIEINGATYPGALRMCNIIADNIALFVADKDDICLIHGDPHFGNILFDSHLNAVFVDSGGFVDGGDIAYDLGKVMCSLRWHDLYIADLCVPFGYQISSKGIVSFEDLFTAKSPVHAANLRWLFAWFLDRIIEGNFLSQRTNAERLMMRSLLYSGVHCVAMASTLVRRCGWRAIGLLIDGIRTSAIAVRAITEGKSLAETTADLTSSQFGL